MYLTVLATTKKENLITMPSFFFKTIEYYESFNNTATNFISKIFLVFFIFSYLSLPTTALAEVVEHIVKKNDTLWAIAGTYLNNQINWPYIQYLNQFKNPNLIQPGDVVQIQAVAQKTYEVQVDSVIGTVWLINARSEAVPLLNNMHLTLGQIIQTESKSFANLLLSNGVRVVIPTNTTVMITESLNSQGKLKIPRFKLLKGRVEVYAPKMNKTHKTFQVETPKTVLSVHGTHFRVRIEDDIDALEVLEGKVSVDIKRLNNAKSLLVPANYGMNLSGKHEFELTKLMPAPILLASDSEQNEFQTTFIIREQSDIVSWRLQVSKNETYTQLIREIVSKQNTINLADIPSGFYYLRVTGLDVNGLESASNDSYFFVSRGDYEVQVDKTANGNYSLTWQKNVPLGYTFQLSSDQNFSDLIISEVIIESSGINIERMKKGIYFWRIIPTIKNERRSDSQTTKDDDLVQPIIRTGNISF